jgi:hypothetical protein
MERGNMSLSLNHKPDEKRADDKKAEDQKEVVARYKAILRDILDSRPSGTRQRLADAMGKNRSFITQITNPAYAVPIPMQHLPVILEICHINGGEREFFLNAYHTAHPRRPAIVDGGKKMRHISIDVPDFADATKNRHYDHLLKAMLGQLNQLAGMLTDEDEEKEP